MSMDDREFADLTSRYRRELRIHCYRMLGSYEESEDLVQETFLRAWRRLETYEGRSTFRAWLYRIATNACLDTLAKRPAAKIATGPAPTDETASTVPAVAVPWLQPCPDELLISPDDEPDAVVVSRETIELAFLTAVQHLPARQRAALILRDVVGWPAKDTAATLDCTVATANSLLQRARETMRAQLPKRRLEWAPATAPTAEELAVVARYMKAIEDADDKAIGALLAEDARCAQAPWAGGNMSDDAIWYEGDLVDAWAPALHGPDRLEFRLVPVSANLMPAIACYVRAPGATEYEAFGVDVFRIVDGKIAEITCFGNEVFAFFGLPTGPERPPERS
jgi:RNA polymerase sigma-70 factor, ECF subfamily